MNVEDYDDALKALSESREHLKQSLIHLTAVLESETTEIANEKIMEVTLYRNELSVLALTHP